MDDDTERASWVDRSDGLYEKSRTWAYWRERLQECGRCDAGREAGVWAIDVLEREYGHNWIHEYSERSGLPADVAKSPSHSACLIEVVRHAVLLEQCNTFPGCAQVRKLMRSDLSDVRQTHSRLQFEVAALLATAGASARFEEANGGRTPSDVVATFDDVEIRVETFGVFPDDKYRAGSDLADQVSRLVMNVQWQYHVQPEGEILQGFTELDFDSMTMSLVVAGERAQRDHEPVRVEHPLIEMTLIPQDLSEIGTSWSMPGGDPVGWTRTASRLRDKALQATRSGPSWLRVDLLDTMWQLSPWSQFSLFDKVASLSLATREALSGIDGIRGVVLSDGGMTTSGSLLGESSMPVNGAIGMFRKIWAIGSRETIIVQLDSSVAASREADIWWRIYDGESQWLQGELNRHGFPGPDELIKLRTE